MNKEERNSFRKEMIGKLEEQWVSVRILGHYEFGTLKNS